MEMSQADICRLIRDARYAVKLADILPVPFIVYPCSHDTGCQPYIVVKAEGLPTVTVWAGSIWYSSSYEFNDRGRVLGFQPGCEWAEPTVSKFFADLSEAWAGIQAERALERIARNAGAMQRHKDAIDHYRAMMPPDLSGRADQ